jgi:hypothetical protein
MLTTHRPRRRRALVLLVGALGALALLVAAPLGAVGKYTDASGDSNGAADITGVQVASDPTGQVVFTISVADLRADAGDEIGLIVNTDVNSATGSPNMYGADYFFVVDETDNSYGFYRWTGTDWDDAPYTSVRVMTNRTGVTISVNRNELGGTQSFNFWTRTLRGDTSADQADDAPDDGTWNYTLAANGPEIRGVMVVTNPISGPRAGKPFTLAPLGLELPPSDAVATLMPQPESHSCTARLGAKPLAGSGNGRCTFNLKKSARGKKLAVALTVTYQGASKTTQFAFRVG